MNYYQVWLKKQIFIYQSDKKLKVGLEVAVPFRKSNTYGYIIEETSKPEFVTKNISYVVNQQVQFFDQQVQLAKLLANSSFTPLPQAISLILPKFQLK